MAAFTSAEARASEKPAMEDTQASKPGWMRRLFTPWSSGAGKSKTDTGAGEIGAGSDEGYAKPDKGAPKPGFLGRLFRTTAATASADGSGEFPAKFKDLRLRIKADPNPVRVGEDRRIHVIFTIRNVGPKAVRLDFPTTQRVDVLLRNASGSAIQQWSEDRAFENEAAVVVINPGERLEYEVSLATREMTAGERYRIEAGFPAHPSLRVDKDISAVE